MTTFELSNTTCSFKSLANSLSDNAKIFRLTDVKVEGSEDDMLKLMQIIRGHPSLEEFHVENVCTTGGDEVTLDSVVSSLLASATSIRILHIENTPIRSATLSVVSYCSTLQTLSLPKNGYKDADASVIADALLGNASSNVQAVDLSGNELSDVSGQYLERLLEKNTSVHTLSLNGNANMSGDEFDKISAKLVGRAAMAA